MPPFDRQPLARGHFAGVGRRCALALIGCVSSIAWLSLIAGCQPERSENPTAQLPALSALGTDPGQAIVAQGQLKPAGGIIPITAPPGDRVASIDVRVGSKVEAGEILGRLVSQEAEEIELEIARTRLQEARDALDAEQRVARARLDVATVELEQAELRVQQARQQLERAEAEGGRFDLLQQRVTIAQNKLEQLRSAANDPTAGGLVTPSQLREQQLTVDQAIDDLETARREAQAGIETAQLAVESARKEIEAAELAIETAEASAGLGSLEQQVQLLQLRIESVQLKSPIDGTVLAIDVGPGEPTAGTPIMRLADTSQMVCRTEINVAELPRLELNAEATITSPAIESALEGYVESISPLIGSPTLPDPNPMARVDWRSVMVTIRIRGEDASRAANLINLQVDVAIAADDDDEVAPPEPAEDDNVAPPEPAEDPAEDPASEPT